MLRKVLVLAAAAALLGGAPALAAGPYEPREVHWDFEGPLGKFDQEQLQRGYKVFSEVCQNCHSADLMSYRTLGEKGGPFWNPKFPNPNDNPVVKAIAAGVQVDDIDPDTGDKMQRPGTTADRFKRPFPNEPAARASNGGALPPDLSVITKAREGGPSYVFSILTGYNRAPSGFDMSLMTTPPNKHYNPYYPGDMSSAWKGPADHVPNGGFISMPPPLALNKVTYDDGVKATIDQEAKDVVTFLAWASEPKQTERKQTGLAVMIYLIILSGLTYLSYRRVWRNEFTRPVASFVVGIVGGSGLYDIPGLQSPEWKAIECASGSASDALLFGALSGVEVRFLPRHGRGHRLGPSDIDARANIEALKRAGCTDIVSVSAVGSLREDLPPGTFVVVDQYIDRTRARANSFFGPGLVAHVSMADPVCPRLSGLVAAAARAAGAPVVEGGAYLAMEGPQFSTRAESELYRSWGAAVIGMTGMPEAKLAREAELPYASLTMVTDFDAWRAGEAGVQVSDIVAVMHANADLARETIRRLIEALPAERQASPIDRCLDQAIVTPPSARDPAVVSRLSWLLRNRDTR